MLEARLATVTSVAPLEGGVLQLLCSIRGQTRAAYAYRQLIGKVQPGDTVLLNTTASRLDLGTGGLDYVIANMTQSENIPADEPGHIMKLRYTPLQHSMMTEEEQAPEEFAVIADLERMPVVATGLHSQVALAAAGAKAVNPDCKIVYVMTDGAALPLGLSDMVRMLKKEKLIDGTITCGQAFGGDRETATLFTGLAAAKKRAGADIAIVGQGPGNVGTGTALGYSGIEAAVIINAARALGARAICAMRMSQADPRERHRLISHHTLTVLSKVALADCMIALPEMEDDIRDQVYAQLQALKLFEHHEVRTFDGMDGVRLLEKRGLRVTSMGRGYEEDPLFFLAGCAAGRAAAEMLRESFWG